MSAFSSNFNIPSLGNPYRPSFSRMYQQPQAASPAQPGFGASPRGGAFHLSAAAGSGLQCSWFPGSMNGRMESIRTAVPFPSQRDFGMLDLTGAASGPKFETKPGGVLRDTTGSLFELDGSVRNRLGDRWGIQVVGPSFEVGDSGLQASLISAKGSIAASVGQASVEVGLDASTRLWTGQQGRYGGEFNGTGAWVQKTSAGDRCIGIGFPVLESSACVSRSWYSGVVDFFKNLW